MSPPRILLHAGSHKTGTTAIQAFAAQQRTPLFQRGLYYPLLLRPDGRPRSNSHNPLAHQFARISEPWKWDKEWLRHRLDEVDGGTLFLSAEAFWRQGPPQGNDHWIDHRRAYLQRLAGWLGNSQVEVVVVLREQAAFANSVYLENIMKGNRRGRMEFQEFRDFLAGRHLRYQENLGLFEELIGPIRLLSYDELASGSHLCHHFFSTLGWETTDLPEPGRIRTSLSIRQARIKQALGRLGASSALNSIINGLLRRRVSRQKPESGGGSEGLGFWKSMEERQAWQAAYRAENEAIRARYRPDMEALFPEGK